MWVRGEEGQEVTAALRKRKGAKTQMHAIDGVIVARRIGEGGGIVIRIELEEDDMSEED